MTSALRYAEMLADARTRVRELMPWDLAERLAQPDPPPVLDVREPNEFAQARIAGSLNVPRGVLEAAHKLGIGRNTITRKIQELGLED